MNYYILKEKHKRWIVPFQEVLDPAVYSFEAVLTPQQAEFFVDNVNASVDEVLNMALYVPPPFDLTQYKASMKSSLSQMSFDVRTTFLPDYRIQNALLGMSGYENKATLYATICEEYRGEYYRIAGLIDASTNKEDVDVSYHFNQFEQIKSEHQGSV